MALGVLAAPGVSASTGVGESDARAIPWSTIERLALEGGVFAPRYQPVSNEELVRLLDRAEAGLPADAAADRALLHFWRDRLARGGGERVWTGCPCKEYPPELRLRGGAAVGWQTLGDVVPGEAGLAWAPGSSAALELDADLEAGHWWLGLGGRAAGRLRAGGRALDPDDALAWPGWPTASGRTNVGRARAGNGSWALDVPRAMAGVRLGNWSLTGGWAPRRAGPGMSGGLTLDRGGPSFPALTGRRTRPFRWRGFMKWLAPDDLLMRVGQLSGQDVRFHNEAGVTVKRAHPWFFEWLVGWEPVSWLRVAATHTAMAATEEGTLWADVLQINFPVIGTTWRERESGPATDRIFAVQFEGRWRDAPWPLLPSTAGRVWWEYGGTDFLPSGPGGLVPEISAPASVAGVTFYDPAWDLSAEYSELQHDKILWYGNAGYPDGYSHDGWLLGHALGGSGEGLAGTLRVRPSGLGAELGLEVARQQWGMPRQTPGRGERTAVTLAVRQLPGRDYLGRFLGAVHVTWFREEARPEAAAAQQDEGWNLRFTVGMP